MCSAPDPEIEIGLRHVKFLKEAVRHFRREMLAGMNEDGGYPLPATHFLQHGSHFDEVWAGADHSADSKVFHAGNSASS
jgi:hypothetical protein